MASVKYEVRGLPAYGKADEPGLYEAWLCEWKNLQAGDVGVAATEHRAAARSVQIEGAFGSLLVEGSNDGENYYTVATATAPCLVVLETDCRLIRPRAVSGGPYTVSMLLRRS